MSTPVSCSFTQHLSDTMWTQASAVLLLFTCCFLLAETQSNSSQNLWGAPIRFKTKGNDLCTMIITSQGEYTRLRLSCENTKWHSYWCEYLGTPHTCRSYNKNPRHYFIQIMWDLRKLHNACKAPRNIRPHMCRKATSDSQMVFSSASFLWSTPGVSVSEERPAAQSASPESPTPTRQDSPVSTGAFQTILKTTQRVDPQSVMSHLESSADRMARQYCWRSLYSICTYVIGLFRNEQ